MTDETIFATALEKADPAERAAFLADACRGDAERRERLESLLLAHAGASRFLERSAADPDEGESRTLAHEAGAPPEEDEVPLGFLAPATRPDSLGRIGHYEVLQVLGKGGFGIVFRAFDDVLHRVVAVKVLSPQMAATSPARKRFLREARSSAQVRHENVVQVYEVGEQPLPYIAMEFIPGETLQQRLDRTGPVEVSDVLRIGRQIAEGLAAAHATDLIHRDIKPGNVLLEGGAQRVKITDFGLARAADDASISQSGIIAGTPMFMAPEQAKGETLDQRADLFSLGSVLYQMAAGRPPFRANGTLAVLKRVAEDAPRPIREVIPETPQWLCDIIAKLHAKDPDDRYQSAREVADVLADCEAQLKANARLKDYSRIPRSTQPRSGRWKWAAAAAVLIPFMALTATELTGITHLFHKQPGVVQSPNSAPSPDDSESEGWVQLFNGKDLTGWKKHLNAPAPWTVENGILKGSSSKGYLFSERGDYKNFHLRVEAMINGGGDCEISFRAPFDVAKVGPNLEYYGAPNCYITYIHKWVLLRDRPTPSIARVGPPREYPKSLFNVQDDSLIRPNEWFTLDLIADGNHFITKINGKEAANCTDPLSAYDTGHFALGLFGEATVVQFRKIEIKELPASSSPPAVAPFTDADVQRIAALPAPQQVQEVRKELMRRNPGFDGIVKHKIEDGVVTELKIVTDQVTDVAPIRVFDALRVLECTGTWTYSGPDDRPLLEASGQLADLTPLAGMNLASLTHLSLSATKAGDAGMVYFKDCKNLTNLNLLLTQVGDAGLVHFKDCKALTELKLAATKVSDAGLANFKDCKNLTFLWLIHTRVGDAGMVHFQGCKALMNLNLARTKVGDAGLVHFKDCKNLTYLWLDHAPVGDAGLAQLKGIPLRKLYINNTAITDLAPLQGMPLEEIRLTPKNITRGVDILRDMKSLKTIGIAGQQLWPAAEFWERYDKGEFGAAFTHADVKRITALPAAEQVEEVRKELVRRNPGFDGTVGHKIDGGVVTEIRVVTDKVTDISPIRVFDALRVLDCGGSLTRNWVGNGQLAELSPLKGMNLSQLTELDLKATKVGDEGMAYFEDCKNLKLLDLGGTQVSDNGLAHFKDCKDLTTLCVAGTKVTDEGMGHFKNCKKLAALNMTWTDVTDTGLAHLKDCKDLTRLWMRGTKVTDLSPLKGMRLKELTCNFQPERDAEILRTMKTLETINGKPAAEFWKEVDKK